MGEGSERFGPPSRDLFVAGGTLGYVSPGRGRSGSGSGAFRRRRPRAPLRRAAVRLGLLVLNGSSLPEDLVERAAALGLPPSPRRHKWGFGCPALLEGGEGGRAQGTRRGGSDARRATGRRSAAGPPWSRPAAAAAGNAAAAPDASGRKPNGYRHLCRLLSAGRWGAERRGGRDMGGGGRARRGAARPDRRRGEPRPPCPRLARRRRRAPASLEARRALPGRVHVELQRHGLREEEHANRALVDLAAALKLPLLATNGVRYAERAGKELHDAPLVPPPPHDAGRRGGAPPGPTGAAPEGGREMGLLFGDLPEALANAATSPGGSTSRWPTSATASPTTRSRRARPPRRTSAA